jgi:hypothetical protein
MAFRLMAAGVDERLDLHECPDKKAGKGKFAKQKNNLRRVTGHHVPAHHWQK